MSDLSNVLYRLDEQGKLINNNGEQISELTKQTGMLFISVYGDSNHQQDGLLVRQRSLEATVQDLVDKLTEFNVRWDMICRIAKIGLGILIATGLGVWLPVVEAFFDKGG